MDKIPYTGFTATSLEYDNTAVEFPYYETTSERGSLIEVMKNGEIVVNEVIISDEEALPKEENLS